MGLVLLSVIAVLFAPVAGRNGWVGIATGLLAVAVGAGVTSFALALTATLRAGRRARRGDSAKEER